MAELGIVQVTLPPGETLQALRAGTIDAAEFAGPASDLGLAFHDAAKFYYWPGVHEPNGSSEVVVSRRALDSLPTDLRAVLEHACATENASALAESERRNAAALARLTDDFDVELRRFPSDVIDATRAAARDLYADLEAQSGIEGEIAASYTAFRETARPWSRLSLLAFLDARNNT